MAEDATKPTENDDVLELTDREKIIAGGGDPDAEPEKPAEGTQGGDAKPGEPSEPPAANGTDATPAVPDRGDPVVTKPVEDVPVEPEPTEPEPTDGEPPTTWVDDETREVASSYGISNADLEDFGSKEEFERATRLFDRQLLAGEQKPAAPVAPAPPKPEPQVPLEAPTAEEQVGKLDVKKYQDAGYDEDTVALVRAHNAMLERVEELNKAQAQVEEARHAEEDRQAIMGFHEAMDALDERRYGRAERGLKSEQDANREKVYNQTVALHNGMQAHAERLGRQLEPISWAALTKRAERLVFGDEIIAEEKRQYQERVAAQARKRRPAPGRARPVAPAKASDEDAGDETANHPEVIKIWDKLQATSDA